LWINGLILWGLFSKAKKWSAHHGDDYVQFWKYKIFK
jgi:hypothetical protein